MGKKNAWHGVMAACACAALLLGSCGKRLEVLKTDAGPSSLAMDARGRYLYVACEGSHTVMAWDLKKRACVSRAEVAPGSLRLYLNRDTQTLRVFAQDARRLYIFKGPSLTLQQSAALPAEPSAWVFYPERRMDVVTGAETNKIYSFEAGTPLSPLDTGQSPADLFLEPGTDKLWIANAKSRSLTMVHLEKNQLRQTIPVHANPIRFQMPEAASTLYVLCTGRDDYPASSVVQMVDLPNRKAGLTYTLGEDVRDFSLGPLGKYIYSISPQGLTVYNLLTDASLRLPTGRDPRCVVVSPDGAKVYVSSRAENAVYVHIPDKSFR